MPEPKFPHIKVKLSGTDGNAFSLVGKVRQAMRNADVELAQIEAFEEEAMDGDYDHVLQTCMATVQVS